MLGGGVLGHQALAGQARQVAVHLGGALSRLGGNGGEAGRAAQARERLQDGHARLGGLHALAALGLGIGGQKVGHGMALAVLRQG